MNYIRKSFTLLEMLIVLGIIAVILSIISVSYSTTQKKSRDARRKTDLKNIQSALEQYYSACGYVYPTGLATDKIMCGASPAIMTGVPTDPRLPTPYTYTPINVDQGFTLCTDKLESESPATFCVGSQQ
jgi:prepilin-type N-terminal cleavage/methylation domain-containing protein